MHRSTESQLRALCRKGSKIPRSSFGSSSCSAFIRNLNTSKSLAKNTIRQKSWVPSSSASLEQAVILSLVHKLTQEHIDTIQKGTPWFLRNMPSAYFREVGDSTRQEHLKGFCALKGIGQDIGELTIHSVPMGDPDGLNLTHMRTDARPGVLHDMLKKLKSGQLEALRRVRIFTSADGALSLNIFTFDGPDIVDVPPASAAEGERLLEYARSLGGTEATNSEDSLIEYIAKCHPAYVRGADPYRFMVNRSVYSKVRGTDNVAVHIEAAKTFEGGKWVFMAVPNALPQMFLTKLAELLVVRGLNVHRLQPELVKDPSNASGSAPGNVALITFLVTSADAAAGSATSLRTDSAPAGGKFDDLTSDYWQTLQHDLSRLKWLDDDTTTLALTVCPELGMDRAEILTALCSMLHGTLSKQNQYGFSRPSLRAVIADPRYARYASDIADLFMARFNPDSPMPNDEFQLKADALRERVTALQGSSARVQMLKMIDAVELTKRTNFYVPNRYGLALRVDPSLLVEADESIPMPFGALFVHGNRFDGFHNRFQNIARGGLRIVTPATQEQHAIESARCYDEAYGLSFAQQLKNKDIPEGGAKAVVLVQTPQDATPRVRDSVTRTAVKSFTDAMLDLIVPVQSTRSRIVDHLGFEELIYLGPDEQVTPDDINWIIKRAGQRGYPIPNAFMSSKPLAGINHKEYGVTSEGVVVFLDSALRHAGLNPDTEKFTIKITGGPDGDVAGNLMRILSRDYGTNAQIVGVADGSGCAEDPDGLDHEELIRLFNAADPIAKFDPAKLSPHGELTFVDTEDGVRKRNSMHNRVKSDVFVPAGGRPATVHKDNWRDFLDPETGNPSSPLIVEGANIFITPEARKGLFEVGGVTIVKDSSANKCGVICSSYEICASMMLEDAEFLDIKEELVEDVLVRLRQLAQFEAEVLFREYANYAGSLPYFSERLSKSINKTKVAILNSLGDMQRGDDLYCELRPLFVDEHLPKKLAAVAGDRVDSHIPLDYMRVAYASCLASKLLYKEGINFLESQPDDRLADLALRYVREEKRIGSLVDRVGSPDAALTDADRKEVMRLILSGGVRSALNVY